MYTIIKTFSGYSGSKVLLLQNSSGPFVRKYGQHQRNIERLQVLTNLHISVPKIVNEQPEYYDMEYIHGVDMVNWLLHNRIDAYVTWLLDYVDKVSRNSYEKDYTDVYNEKLKSPILEEYSGFLPFTPDQLIERLPRILPSSEYHGDLTMDNCMFGSDGKFYLIDPLTSVYDSWVFDLSKIMQDLMCGWFIRNQKVMLYSKLWSIRSNLVKHYPVCQDPNLLILMLMRILPYAKNDIDRQFIIKEICKLWI